MKERLTRVLTSLTAKYVAVFTLLVAVPALAVAAYTLSSSYNREKADLVQSQQEKAKSLADAVDRTLITIAARLGGIELQGLAPSQQELLLRPLGLSDPNIQGVDYTNRRGRLEDGTNVSRSPEFRVARRDGRYFSPRPYDTQTGYYMLVSAAENYGDGVIGEGLSASGEFEDLISGTRLGRSGYAYAVDRAGRPVAVPRQNEEVMRKLGVGELNTLAYLSPVKEALRSESAVGSTTGDSFRDQKVLSTWATVPSTGWKVFVEQPESVAFAAVRGTLWRTVLLIGAFILAGVALSILVARRFVRPIKRMRLAAARIGAGAYDERIELDPRRPGVPMFRTISRPDAWGRPRPAREVAIELRQPEHRRQDDLGALAEDLNRMAASLQASHTQLERKVEERTHELQVALEQLAARTQELNAASAHKRARWSSRKRPSRSGRRSNEVSSCSGSGPPRTASRSHSRPIRTSSS